MMMTIEEGDLPARVTEWVKAGGTWIVGPLSDIRTSIGSRYRDRPFGILEELTGATWLYGIPDRVGNVSAADKDGKPLGSTLWYDIYDAAEENTLARVSGGHSSIDGKACIVSYQVGAGRVILLGTFPDYHALKSIYTAALNDAGVENGKAEGELMVIPRKGDEISGLILVEYAGKPAAYTLDKPMKCAKTGAVAEGKIDIEPYGIVILQNI
jgi:beta-galactosidase GanA